jgi:SAM-dependent methyltransferase
VENEKILKFNDLTRFMNKPDLFTVDANSFWDDEHISKKLLEAHLNSDDDAASRRSPFLDKSAAWIAQKAPPKQYAKLLDLGCGPGLYAERFATSGYAVTGIDFSKRSIEYAKEQALINKSEIDYHYQNYLTIDFDNEFDVVTLIYCDFGALSTASRHVLAKKIYRALKPGGKFILDVFTLIVYLGKSECRTWQYNDSGGFWSEKPYISLDSVYHYDGDTTELRQSIVQTDEWGNCYNIWEHFFTKEELLSEMRAVGFDVFELYGDVSGKEFSDAGDTICGIVTK